MKNINENLPSILIILGSLYLVSFVTYIAIFQDKLFIAIVSSLGTLFVQRYVENLKNERKQQEFARLTISRIKWRQEVLFYLRKHVILSANDSTEIKRFIIMRYINQIKQDEVYKSMLKDIGILPLNILKYFSEYDSSLKNLIDSLEDHSSHDSGQSLYSSNVQENLAIQIIYNAIDATVTTMLLSKQILKAQNEFEADKQFLISEYWRAKDAILQGEYVPSVILNSLAQIEAVFKELGMSNYIQVPAAIENQ
ncbi:hypothetical protein H6F74_09865 [Trichocoleus sp. FACHB-90]|uniref:hypothetical protein n=1 Tax=Cyanophyceae TaxID=3028117 RepID=UPI001683D1D8|nr:hypothetical protein [Trichocoleus sp. FACHB-90]MBD1926547.1 hypothetical protein [Trichocoleus sp. FACHB-90]